MAKDASSVIQRHSCGRQEIVGIMERQQIVSFCWLLLLLLLLIIIKSVEHKLDIQWDYSG